MEVRVLSSALNAAKGLMAIGISPFIVYLGINPFKCPLHPTPPIGSEAEWADALLWLLDNPGKAAGMGTTGRQIVEEHYSLKVLVPRLADYIKRFAR